jgi:hypothetical protein
MEPPADFMLGTWESFSLSGLKSQGGSFNLKDLPTWLNFISPTFSLENPATD